MSKRKQTTESEVQDELHEEPRESVEDVYAAAQAAYASAVQDLLAALEKAKAAYTQVSATYAEHSQVAALPSPRPIALFDQPPGYSAEHSPYDEYARWAQSWM